MKIYRHKNDKRDNVKNTTTILVLLRLDTVIENHGRR